MEPVSLRTLATSVAALAVPLASSCCTKAVVEISVEESAKVAVGAVGEPVSAGLASGALRPRAVLRSDCAERVPEIEPQEVDDVMVDQAVA